MPCILQSLKMKYDSQQDMANNLLLDFLSCAPPPIEATNHEFRTKKFTIHVFTQEIQRSGFYDTAQPRQ